jgi:hypothetical protein
MMSAAYVVVCTKCSAGHGPLLAMDLEPSAFSSRRYPPQLRSVCSVSLDVQLHPPSSILQTHLPRPIGDISGTSVCTYVCFGRFVAPPSNRAGLERRNFHSSWHDKVNGGLILQEHEILTVIGPLAALSAQRPSKLVGELLGVDRYLAIY